MAKHLVGLLALAFALTACAATPSDGGTRSASTTEGARPELTRCQSDALHSTRPHVIHILDRSTGRGVPMIELRTTAEVSYWSDSQGVVSIRDEDLFVSRLGRGVWFHIPHANGYAVKENVFGIYGVSLELRPGGVSKVFVDRILAAERIYRTTGKGIYAHSVAAGLGAFRPNDTYADVTGQDSILHGRLNGYDYWVWGDTNVQSRPLGNFHASGAKSKAAETDLDHGVAYEYFVGGDGIVRAMADPPGEGGLLWFGPVVVANPDGSGERLYAWYTVRQSDWAITRQGWAVLDESSGKFELRDEWMVRSDYAGPYPMDAAVRTDVDGQSMIFFGAPATIRVREEDLLDVSKYEGLTPLVKGTSVADEKLDRKGWVATLTDAVDSVLLGKSPLGWHRKLAYDWKVGTPPLNCEQEEQFVSKGLMTRSEARLAIVRAEGDDAFITIKTGTVSPNPYRGKWILIFQSVYDKPSSLGQVYYSEGPSASGPFTRAVKIVTHDVMSFYNIQHHRDFDKDHGRVIYFEGTHTKMFTDGAAVPEYEYNNQMYRLTLDDPRLRWSQEDE